MYADVVLFLPTLPSWRPSRLQARERPKRDHIASEMGEKSVESVLLDMHEGRNTVDGEEDRIYGAGSEIICGFEKTSKSALSQ